MITESPPTASALGSYCRPEVYLQGLLNECRLEGDRPFVGCPFAHHVGKNRFCKHPSLLQAAPLAANADPGTSATNKVPDLMEAWKQAVPPPAVIPPRIVLQEKYPQLLERIELMWGSMELHEYFRHANRQGFPPDVIQALNEMDSKHMEVLKAKGILNDDFQDWMLKK